MNQRGGNLLRAIVAMSAIGLIWIVWRPVYFTLGQDIVQADGSAQLGSLPSGTEFILKGAVESVAPIEHQWQGRFAFVHRERKDFAGGPSKDQRVVDIENWRPALRFLEKDGIITLEAGSYGLKYAPRVERRFWPRKWLWTKRVDDWHPTSTGFRAGEAALAYGRVLPGGQLQVEELMQSPLRDISAQISEENRLRHWLTLGFKIVLSLGCLNYALPHAKDPLVDQKPSD